MRRHPTSPRSIASYLAAKELTIEDREFIAEVTEPKDWSAKYLDVESLSEDELNMRAVILSRIKKYPAIVVSQRFIRPKRYRTKIYNLQNKKWSNFLASAFI